MQDKGEAVLANNTEKMEGFVNGTIQEDNHKAQSQSLSEDKEVAVEVDDSHDGDIFIAHEEEAPQNEEKKMLVESGKVEDVSESVSEKFEPDTVKDAHVENTVESDTVMLEFNEDFESGPDGVKETDLYPSVSRNEGLRESEVAEEEKNVVFHAVSKKLIEEANDVCGGDSSLVETWETSVPKSCESDKVTPTIIEKSLDLKQSLEEKVEESSGGLEESSYESAKESFQPSPSVVPDAESNENLTTVPLVQREISSWKSCCGLIEIMRGGHR
ncbi:neurofilament medium polypeptide isoform X2 [Vigna radiata var. radiata]|uniref:Neurofilament medium polypeptide isoform X2 n=1 Tax=Vigna radiata var. radiata TaxID=3916 RepID=A0A3Q0F588_VIGRR|nr:neurofilament medium polypeptide isoform X2 [Vigna radiata var. radiata]